MAPNGGDHSVCTFGLGKDGRLTLLDVGRQKQRQGKKAINAICRMQSIFCCPRDQVEKLFPYTRRCRYRLYPVHHSRDGTPMKRPQ
jgi:hypothetical protein